MKIKLTDPSAPEISGLLALHLRELREVMEGFACGLDASGLSTPEVSFWSAWNDDTLLGFGALKALASGDGEVKSMRAAPAARGTGVGRQLLRHIIAAARDRNYACLLLETGTAELHRPAIALYQSEGFVPCEPFADYQPSPHNQFFRLDL